MTGLRQALDTFPSKPESWWPIQAAARSWLTLQEADETIVEKVARLIRDSEDRQWELWDNLARAVLAAIVGEET